jgi:flagella basal body P-ring formation protein FlgA
VRAGSPATLLLEGAHVHISLSVVCLESGAVGQTIRASSPDHRQVYKAQVVRDGVLEGRL